MSERTDTIADELLALRSDDGRINPAEAVVWAKRHTKSRLHGALEWDDAVAGERYRIWQVRALISTYVLDVATGDRKFVSVSIDRQSGGYRSLAEVIATPDLREVMVADALAELERVQKRYERVTELQTVWAEADKVRSRRKTKAAA
jgi:hypothetical protein